DYLEPNDSYGAATDLRVVRGTESVPGLTVHENADGSDNVDYYRFDTVATGTSAHYAEIQFAQADGDLDMALYDGSQSYLTGSASVTDNERVSLDGRPAGTYYLKVYGFGSATAPYDLVIVAPLDGHIPPDDYEGAEPTRLAQNQTLRLTIHDPAQWNGQGSKADSFSFTMAEPGALSDYVRTRFAHEDGNVDMWLYDGDGNFVAGSTTTTDNEWISLNGLPAGTYTLVVDTVNADTCSYGLAIVAPFQTGGLAEWTVLVYIAGENDLEGAALEDLNEMEAVPLPAGICAAIMLDRAIGGFVTTPDWTDTRVGVVQSDSNPNVISTPLQSWGERNLGDPQTLADFINWGVAALPAQHYAVILWDHGGSLYGSMVDGADELTTDELRAALEAVPTHIDVLGFDACLMGNLEIMYQVRNEISYFVASEEIEGWDGWDYTGLFADLAAAPSLSPEQFANVIVTSSSDDEAIVTLSAADASGAGLPTAVTQFVTTVLPGATTADWSAMEAARDASAGFHYPEFRDLGSFMSEVAARVQTTGIADAAEAVLSALADQVVANYSRPSAGGTGLSVYLPDVGDQVPGWYSGLSFATATGWDDFLAALTGRTAGTLPGRDWAEANDYRATSYNLRALAGHGNRYENLSIHNASDRDWFRFVTLVAGQAGDQVQIAFTNAEGNLDLALYDAQGALLASSTTTLNVETISLEGRPAGAYFVRIAGASGATNRSYSLIVDAPGALPDWLEDNNEMSKASALSLNATTAGLNLMPGDEDWFSFAISRLPGSPVSATVKFPRASALELQLYDAQGSLLASATGSSGRLTVRDTTGAASQYYVRVTGAPGAFVPYALKVGETADPPPPMTLVDSRLLNGLARVSVYDADPADGAPLPNIAWGRGDPAYQKGVTDLVIEPGVGGNVASITLLDGAGSLEDIGIVIEGTGVSLGSVKDKRRTPAPLAFFICQGAMGSLGLRSDLAGADLNGFTAPGGWALPDDLDDDGDTDDVTGLLAQGAVGKTAITGNLGSDALSDEGFASLSVRGAVAGDVRAGGGMPKLAVTGAYNGALSAAWVKSAKIGGLFSGTVTLTGADPKKGVSLGKLTAGRVGDMILSAVGGVGGISAAAWANGALNALWLGSLSLKGATGVPGNCGADLTLWGSLGVTTLKKAKIGGSAVRGLWDITGAAGSVAVGGNFANCTLEADLLKSLK
ncbi:MAG: T9SS type A sorting domain-containing protein, partial [Armatimonadota bacterium]